jgi:hypothetical protein
VTSAGAALENTIGKGAIKIACIQCIPGYEWDVQSELEILCRNNKKIQDYTFLKGVGSFDIILIYQTEDFGPQLRESGPIDHIIKSNLLLCFPFSNKTIGDLFKEIKRDAFTAFFLLKINPKLKSNYPEIEKELRAYLAKNDDLHLLGSIGWSELVLVLSTNKIDRIYRYILEAGNLSYPGKNDEKLCAILKTLTFVGINYAFLPGVDVLENGQEVTDGFFASQPVFNHPVGASSGVKGPIVNISTKTLNLRIGASNHIKAPIINISTKSIYLKEINEYFEKLQFEIAYSTGKFDISVKPIKENIKWSKLLSALVYLRYSFKDKLFATHTQSLFYQDCVPEIDIIDQKSTPEPYPFDYPDLELIFGTHMASHLTNLFITLNSLNQNPLIGDLYSKMMIYPQYVYEAAQIINPSGQFFDADDNGNKLFALIAGHVIRRGAEIRSYGTYDTIEEVTGRFSEFKGGCQVPLVALEVLTTRVLKNSIKKDWYGFVTVSGDPQFSHYQEVLNVTPTSLWNPQEWWAIYHEIAHIIINKKSDLVNSQLPEIKKFLANRPQAIFHDIVELTAEIIGFEIGMFGDLELYFGLMWDYLHNLDPYNQTHLSKYAVRSFFIEIFNGHFRNHKGVDKIEKEDFELDALYGKFVKHLNKIESHVKKEVFKGEKYYIASQNVKDLKELYPYSKLLSDKLIELDMQPDLGHLSSQNTTEVKESIFKGVIWSGNIASPQAIMYHLFRKSKVKNLDFNVKIATLLSLWNQKTGY